MNTDHFYAQILGISAPWIIKDVDVNMDNQRVDIYITYDSNKANCQCGKQCLIHDRAKSRTWRHLDTCQLITYIHCSLPRTKCDTCKVKTHQPPWAQPSGRFTMLFEELVINWLLISHNQTKVAKQMNLSFDEVHGIMERAVERGLSKRSEKIIEKLSIDEKSMKKGHHYLTVLSDPDTGTVIEVCETRKESAVVDMLLSNLTENQRKEVKSISMDMWTAFMNAAKKTLPKADIVHDHFHITQYLTKAVDSTRKQENKRLLKEGIDALKGSKYLFLRNFCNLKEKYLERFAKAKAASEKTAKAWEYKELFREFFTLSNTDEGKNYLQEWYDLATAEDIAPLTKAANTINNHKKGILNYLKHRVTNAFAECLNGKIQELKSRARGFKAFANYRVNILFHFGGLQLSPLPHKTP